MIGTIITITILWWFIGVIVMVNSDRFDTEWDRFASKPSVISYLLFLSTPHLWPIYIVNRS